MGVGDIGIGGTWGTLETKWDIGVTLGLRGQWDIGGNGHGDIGAMGGH